MLFIRERCTRLLETLPVLQHDPNRPEDVLKVDADEEGVGGDDAADALRYLVATKSRTVTVRKLKGFKAGRMDSVSEVGLCGETTEVPPASRLPIQGWRANQGTRT